MHSQKTPTMTAVSEQGSTLAAWSTPMKAWALSEVKCGCDPLHEDVLGLVNIDSEENCANRSASLREVPSGRMGHGSQMKGADGVR